MSRARTHAAPCSPFHCQPATTPAGRTLARTPPPALCSRPRPRGTIVQSVCSSHSCPRGSKVSRCLSFTGGGYLWAGLVAVSAVPVKLPPPGLVEQAGRQQHARPQHVAAPGNIRSWPDLSLIDARVAATQCFGHVCQSDRSAGFVVVVRVCGCVSVGGRVGRGGADTCTNPGRMSSSTVVVGVQNRGIGQSAHVARPKDLNNDRGAPVDQVVHSDHGLCKVPPRVNNHHLVDS